MRGVSVLTVNDSFVRPYIDRQTGATVMLTDAQKAADVEGRYREIHPEDDPRPIDEDYPPEPTPGIPIPVQDHSVAVVDYPPIIGTDRKTGKPLE